MDLDRDRYDTFDDLREYCRRVASTVGLVCIEIFGQRVRRAREYAVNLGIALQLTNILRDVGGDAERGRIYLPQEDLRRFGCSNEDLRAGTLSTGVRQLLAFERQRAGEYYARAAELRAGLDARALVAAEIMGRIYRETLDRIERAATTSSPAASVCHERGGSPSLPTRGCGPGSAVMSRPDVVVIGAGFAGLSAAVRLVEAGARVVVVEERRRLGGRATAFADPQTGEVVDNGQHALFGCYRETFAFLRAIDAYQNVALDERLDIEVVDRRFSRSRLVTTQWTPPLHLVGGLLRWSALGLRDRAGALRMGLALRRLSRLDDEDTWERLGEETAEAWLIECGQTARLRELLWEPLVVAALNQSPATAAAAPFVRV